MSVKSDVVSVLTPIFGDSVKTMIEQQYDDPKEILDVAKHMLTGYMGEQNAVKILNKIYHQYKIKV